MPDALPEQAQSQRGFCRDCGARLAPEAATAVRCPNCRSPRLVRHSELFDLTIAHIDCDAFYAAIEKRDDPMRVWTTRLGDEPLFEINGACQLLDMQIMVSRVTGMPA